MSSIGAIVKQITETLSDSVSQLVLFVIVLQEQNAEVPPQLPQASTVVGSAAANFVKVAKSVAEQGYSEYPDIKQDIIDAADAVDEAKDSLINAVNELSKLTDRSSGWTTLVDACKTIAGKTVLLLQIVYGAEVLRIFRAAENAEESINKLSVDSVQSSPADFARDIGGAATKANQVGDYVLKKASDTESPLLKKQLEEAGKEIQDRAKNLIPIANALLANPDNVQLKKQTDDALNEIKDLLKKATKPIQESEAEFLPQEKMSVESLGFSEELSVPTDVVEEACFDLFDLAQKNPANVDNALKQVKKATDVVLQQAKQDAQKTTVPADRKKELISAISELEGLIPQQSNAAKDVAKNPNDKKALEKLERLNQRVAELTSNLSAPEALQTANELKKNLKDLAEAAKKGDAAKVDDLERKVSENNKLLVEHASEQIRQEEDPVKKLQIMSALDELDSLIPEQIALVERLAADPSNKELAKDVDHLNDELQNILSSVSGPKIDLSNTSRREDEHVDKLVNAALKGDASGVANEAKNLQILTAKLAVQAREEASKIDDPRRKDDLLKAVQEIEVLLPQEILAAKEVLQKPDDRKAKDKLQELSDKLQEALIKVDPLSADSSALSALQELDRLVVAAKKKDNKVVEDASKQLPKAVAQLASHTKAKAKGVDDPEIQKQLLDAANDLERLVPLHIQAAKSVSDNPQNKDALEKLSELSNAVKASLEDLAGKKAAALDEQIALQDLMHAVANKNITKIEEATRRAEKAQSKLSSQVRAEARRSDDPGRKQQLAGAIEALEILLPAAKSLANKPNEKEKLRDLQEDILEKLNFVSSPETALSDLAKKEEHLANDILLAAKHGDAVALDKLTKKIAETNNSLSNLAKVEASKTENTQRQKNTIDAVSELEKMIPLYIQSSKDASKSKDPASLARLEKLVDDIEKQIHQISEPEAASNAKSLEIELKSVVGAAKKGDSKFVDKKGQDIPVDVNKVVVQAKALARQEDDAYRKNQILSSADEVELLTPQLISASKDVAANPKNSEAVDRLDSLLANLDKALSQIQGDTESQVHSLAATQGKELDKLIVAAKRGKGVDDETNKLIKENALLTKKVKSAANAEDDPAKKQLLLQSVSELEALLPLVASAAKNVSSKPADSKSKEEFEGLVERVKDALADLEDSPTAFTGKKEEKLISTLLESAKKGDTKGTDKSADKLNNTTAKLLAQAKSELPHIDNPHKKKQMLLAIESLENLVPQEVLAAKALAKSPDNLELQEKLKELEDRVMNALHNLTSSPTDASLAAEEHQEDLRRLLNAAITGNKSKVEDEIKHIPDAYAKVIKEARAEARETDNQHRKKLLFDAVDDLERAVPEYQMAARQLAAKPNDKALLDKLQALDDRINKALEKISEPVFVSAVKEVEEYVDKLARAAASGEPKVVADVGLRLTKAAAELVDKSLSEAARISDPDRKEKLLKATADLELSIPQQVLAAKEVLLAPRNAQGHKDLANIRERLQDKLADINFAVNLNNPRILVDSAQKEKEQARNLLISAKRGDLAAAEEAINELANALGKLKKTGLLEARLLADAKDKKDLEAVISSLDQLFKSLEENGKKAAAHPNSGEHQQQLEKDLEELADKIKKLLSLTKAETLAAGDELVRSEDRLLSAAKQHDPKALSDAAKFLNQDLPKFVDKVRKEGSRIDNSQTRKNLAAALEDLLASNGQIAAAAFDLAKDPYNPVAQRKLADLINAAKQLVEEIELDMRPPALSDKAGQAKVKKYEPAKAARAKNYPQADLNPYEDTVKSLEELLAQLETAKQEANRNPNDVAAKKKLADIMSKVKQATDKSASLENEATPEQKLAALVLKEDSDADKLLQASRIGDASSVAENAKNLVGSSKNVVEMAKALANQMEPSKKQALLHSVAELEQLMPDIVNASKVLLQNPNDPAAAAKTIAVNDRLKDIQNDILSLVLTPTESSTKSKAQKEKEVIAAVLAAAQKGDKKALESAVNQLKDLNDNITATLRNQALKLDDPNQTKKLNDISNSIEDILKQFTDDASKLVQNPKDGATNNKAKQDADRLEQALAQAIDATNANIIQDVADLLHEMNNLNAAQRRGDATVVASKAKDYVAKVQKLTETARTQAARTDDQVRKQQLLNNAGEIERLMPLQLTQLKDAMLNPNDKGKKDALKATVAQEEATLASIIAASNPTVDNKLKAAALKEVSDLARLNSAHTNGDTKAVESILNDLRASTAALKQASKAHAGKSDNLGKKQELKENTDELDLLLKLMAESAKKSSKNDPESQQKFNDDLKRLKDKVVELSNTVSTSATVDALAQKQTVDTFLLKLGGANLDNIQQLWEAGQNLSVLLGNLLDQVRGAVNEQRSAKLSERAKAALDLNDMLSGLENLAQESPAPVKAINAEDLDKLFSDIGNIRPLPKSAYKQSSSQSSPSFIAPQQDFSDTVAAIAKNIKSAHSNSTGLLPTDPLSVIINNISTELDGISNAAKSGARQQLLVSGRSISAHIISLDKELKGFIAKIPDPRIQDRFIRQCEMLRNFSTQLKIMAAVKAAGGDKDSDEQMLALTKNIGNILGDLITSINSSKLKYRI